MKTFAFSTSLCFIITGISCMTPRGPEQIHISFGHTPDKMYVMWSMSQPSVTNVTYSPLSTTIELLAIPKCWQFTKGNPSGLQYLCRAELVSRRGWYCAVNNYDWLNVKACLYALLWWCFMMVCFQVYFSTEWYSYTAVLCVCVCVCTCVRVYVCTCMCVYIISTGHGHSRSHALLLYTLWVGLQSSPELHCHESWPGSHIQHVTRPVIVNHVDT